MRLLPDRDGPARQQPGPSPLRCQACAVVHPEAFEFCLACGTRVRQPRRLWPRMPEALRVRVDGFRCPRCQVAVTEIGLGLWVNEDGILKVDPWMCGLEEQRRRCQPTHECHECGRQFWFVRSRW